MALSGTESWISSKEAPLASTVCTRPMGIGILPHHAIRNHLPVMDIVTVDFDEPWAARELRLCVRSYDALSVIARQMVDHPF